VGVDHSGCSDILPEQDRRLVHIRDIDGTVLGANILVNIRLGNFWATNTC